MKLCHMNFFGFSNYLLLHTIFVKDIHGELCSRYSLEILYCRICCLSLQKRKKINLYICNAS